MIFGIFTPISIMSLFLRSSETSKETLYIIRCRNQKYRNLRDAQLENLNTYIIYLFSYLFIYLFVCTLHGLIAVSIV
jgi:hypothetical protein